MRKIIVSVSTNRVGSKTEDEFEVEDDATDEEISKIAYDVMIEMIEYNWDDAGEDND